MANPSVSRENGLKATGVVVVDFHLRMEFKLFTCDTISYVKLHVNIFKRGIDLKINVKKNRNKIKGIVNLYFVSYFLNIIKNGKKFPKE